MEWSLNELAWHNSELINKKFEWDVSVKFADKISLKRLINNWTENRFHKKIQNYFHFLLKFSLLSLVLKKLNFLILIYPPQRPLLSSALSIKIKYNSIIWNKKTNIESKVHHGAWEHSCYATVAVRASAQLHTQTTRRGRPTGACVWIQAGGESIQNETARGEVHDRPKWSTMAHTRTRWRRSINASVRIENRGGRAS